MITRIPFGRCWRRSLAPLGCYLISHRVAAERGISTSEREIAEPAATSSARHPLDTRVRMGPSRAWTASLRARVAQADQFL